MVSYNEALIRQALEVASLSTSNDLPIGAVIVDETGFRVAESSNKVEEFGIASAHAELVALQSISNERYRKGTGRLTLAVTLEPCPMCAWAIRLSGIERVVFGAYNLNYGAGGSVYDLLRDPRVTSRIEVIGGVLASTCQRALDEAFAKVRHTNKW